MPSQDYIGRYGNILRQLSAMDAQPQPGGAFDAQPATPAFAPQDQQTAFGPPETGDTQAPTGGNTSFKDVWGQMPAQHKDALAKQLEDSGLDINANYKKILASGLVELPPDKPTRHDKVMALADVALRTISNYGRPTTTNSGADFADALLAHNKENEAKKEQGQRTALGLAVQQRGDALRNQQEQRQLAARGAEQEMGTAERSAENQANIASREKEGEDDRKNRILLAKLQAAAQKAQGKNVVMDSEGNMFELGENNQANPITAEQDTIDIGDNGKPVVTKTKKQLRGAPKVPKTAMDQDAVLRAIGERVKLLQNDDQFMASLRKRKVADVAGEIRRVAKQQVMDEANTITGKGSANPYDQFDATP